MNEAERKVFYYHGKATQLKILTGSGEESRWRENYKNKKQEKTQKYKIRDSKILWRWEQVEKEGSSQKKTYSCASFQMASNSTKCSTKIMNILVSFLPLVEDFQQHIFKRLYKTQCPKQKQKQYLHPLLPIVSGGILIEQNIKLKILHPPIFRINVWPHLSGFWATWSLARCKL